MGANTLFLEAPRDRQPAWGACGTLGAMFWVSRRRLLESFGARARRVHSAWLTRAVREGRAYPRIPTRRVDLGGFDALMRREGGPKIAERWWTIALLRVEVGDEDRR